MKNVFFLLVFLTYTCIGQTQMNLNEFYSNYVINGKIDYQNLKQRASEFYDLVQEEKSKVFTMDEDLKAQMINVYNLTVIEKILQNYPAHSVNSIPGFFKNKFTFQGKKLNLDQLEADLFKKYNDPLLHLALICGAKSCSPYPKNSFSGNTLEQQLKDHAAYALKSKDILFISDESEVILASKIFQWYSNDFGNLYDFFNQYYELNIPEYRIKYMDYDWSLNAVHDNTGNGNSFASGNLETAEEPRYYASNLYAPGEYEINFFNNYYTQSDPQDGFRRRDNFFSTLIQTLYGRKNMNIGFEIRFRSVSSGPEQINGIFDALKFRNRNISDTEYGDIKYSSRIGLTQIGPRIKYQPIKSISGLTFQHTLHIPLVSNGEGTGSKPFIDWGSPTLFNDIFFDQTLTQKTSLFLQIGAYVENINGAVIGQTSGYWQFSTPITTIVNYFPNKKATLYFLINAAPQFGYSVNGSEFTPVPNHYNQYGLGYKYFIADKVQAEVLVTRFSSVILERKAATYNFGVRYYGW